MLILTAVVLLLNAANAATNGSPSPNPSPSPSKPAEKEKAVSSGKNQHSTPDQKPTTQFSPPVKLPKPQEGKQASDGNANQSSNPSVPDWITWFTAILAVTAILQVIVLIFQMLYNRALNANQRVVERAYVKMSHLPPGLSLAPAPNSNYPIAVRVKNFGQTPATVTDFLLVRHLLPRNQRLPAAPDYSTRGEWEVPNIFLVREDEFVITCNFPVTDQERSAIEEDKTQIFYVCGYVDYIDKFGGRHRAGYARRFNGVIGGEDNLKIVIQDGYNYDRERRQDEGNDWNEPT